MTAYIIGADADLDLDEIWEYIAADDIILYRAERRPIEIVAVTQGSRDIPAFLWRRVHP